MSSRALRLSMMLAVLAVFAGCEGCGNDAQSDRGGGEGDQAGAASTGGGEAAPSGDNALVDPGPAPTLRLAVSPSEDGAQALLVENRGDAPVALRSALVLERREGADEGAAFAAVEGIEGLALRYDCESEVPECVTLVPGAALHPPAWSGDVGDAQCACERCTAAPTGTYRFVVTSCNGAHRVPSPAFER